MDDKQSIASRLRNAKSSSGFPALDAMQRYLRDRHEFQNMKTEQIVSDHEKGKTSLFQKDGDLDPTNEAQMKGRSYTSAQVMKKLSALNRRLHFERSNAYPELIGIYIEHPEGEYKGWKHVMGMPFGEVPQYSVRKPDPEGKRMLIEKRGWMKLLVDLARMGIINMEQAKRKFQVTDVSRNFALLAGDR
jgi:hypothetical protein